jgi:hypothetical protein
MALKIKQRIREHGKVVSTLKHAIIVKVTAPRTHHIRVLTRDTQKV